MSIVFGGWLLLTSLCLLVCVYDSKYRHIPNGFIVSILIVSLLLYNPGVSLKYHILVGLFSCVLYALKVIAGGDFKLICALLPSVDPNYIVPTLCLIGLSGGGVAIICFLYDLRDNGWLKRRGLPYGIAISTGFIIGSAASL
ncbi:prepilin peptidase [Vibrio astriarenae]